MKQKRSKKKAVQEQVTVTIGCRRVDRPPWSEAVVLLARQPAVGLNKKWWASMIEDQVDGVGDTAAEAIGNCVMEIVKIYKSCKHDLPYIKDIVWEGQQEEIEKEG